MNFHPQFLDRYQTLILRPLIGHAGLGRHGPFLVKHKGMVTPRWVPSLRRLFVAARFQPGRCQPGVLHLPGHPETGTYMPFLFPESRPGACLAQQLGTPGWTLPAVALTNGEFSTSFRLQTTPLSRRPCLQLMFVSMILTTNNVHT